METGNSGKKKNKWGIVAIVVCVLAVIGMIGQGKFDPDPEPTTETTTILDIPPLDIPNVEYTMLLNAYPGCEERGFSGDLDCEVFAIENEDTKTLTLEEFGYKDDIVKEWRITFYQDISDYSEDEINEYAKIMKEDMSNYFGSVSCATVNYHRYTDLFFSTTITMSDLDDLSNVKLLIAAGAIEQVGSPELISMEKTENRLLMDGYIAKYNY